MDRPAALVMLTSMTAATSRPVLTPDELGVLLDQQARVDVNGVFPGYEGWVGVWDLNAAAAEGWRWKAGKVAGDFTFSADDASYSKSDVLKACLEMEASYRRKIVGAVGLGYTDLWATNPDLVVNG